MKSNDIIIDNFQKGVAPSPHLGYADMRNVDVESIPGVVRINNRVTKKSGSTVTGKTKWMVKNPRSTSEIWALDDDGVVYKSTDSGDTWATVAGNSVGFGQGLVIWKDYLFVAASAKLEVYGPLSSSPSWTTNWKTIDSDTEYHPMVHGQDDILYGGAGRYVYSLQELTTFAPGSSGTYTFTQQALDLPANYRIKCLAELGKFLMIGTWQGSSIFDTKIADIFPWDRSSTTFNIPLSLNENGVNAMITINNLLYILGGIEGKIFVSNGTQVTEVGKIPISIANIEGGKFFDPSPGAVINHKGRLFFGLSCNSGSGGLGVWSFKLGKDENRLQFEHVISTGNYGTLVGVDIGALLATNRDIILIGWRDDATYGIDKVENTKRYTSYAAYFDSKFYPVGSNQGKTSFTQIEFQLAKPLTTGQGIKLSYRTNLSASFTAIGTFDYATYNGITSYVAPAQIREAEFVQIRCELTTGESDTTPELRAIILR